MRTIRVIQYLMSEFVMHASAIMLMLNLAGSAAATLLVINLARSAVSNARTRSKENHHTKGVLESYS